MSCIYHTKQKEEIKESDVTAKIQAFKELMKLFEGLTEDEKEKINEAMKRR